MPETAACCLANLPPVAPRWLWQDRIPIGKIVLLAGPSGAGKTFIALDIAPRITTNNGFPEPTAANPFHPNPATTPPAPAATPQNPKSQPMTPECPSNSSPVTPHDLAPTTPRVGSVLLITPEEDLLDNVRPRLEAAHADVDKLTAATDLRIENLTSCAAQIDDLKLIIIDPLAFLIANDNESPCIAPKLFDLYRRLVGRSISILALLPMHPGRADPLHRIPGLTSLAPYASIIYAVSPDHREENAQPNRRVLIQLKNNLSPIVPAMAFTIENSAVAWSQEAFPDQNIDAIISTPRRKSGPDPIKLDHCIQWLYEFLAPNPRPQTEVIQAAASAGFSYITLRRAKVELNIQSKREKEGRWLWRAQPGQLEYDNFDQITDELLSPKYPPPT